MAQNAALHEGLLTDPTADAFAEMRWQNASGGTRHVDQIEILDLDDCQAYNATSTAPADTRRPTSSSSLSARAWRSPRHRNLKVDAATSGATS